MKRNANFDLAHDYVTESNSASLIIPTENQRSIASQPKHQKSRVECVLQTQSLPQLFRQGTHRAEEESLLLSSSFLLSFLPPPSGHLGLQQNQIFETPLVLELVSIRSLLYSHLPSCQKPLSAGGHGGEIVLSTDVKKIVPIAILREVK
jgi:hypothetical protein